jgi:hypothetical protein
MDPEILNIDTVRTEARTAARNGIAALEACPYVLGSPGAKLFLLEYVKEANRLHNAHRRANPDHPIQPDEGA